MRTLPLSFRQALYSESTSEFPITLLTLTHPNYDGVLRLSTDPTVRISDTPLRYGTVSRGQTFMFAPMAVVWPDDTDKQAPVSRIVTENVSRDLVKLVRSFSTPGNCMIEIVSVSALDTVVVSYPQSQFKNIQGNSDTISLELTIDALTTEPYPADNFNPAWFPGLA